MRLFIAEKPSLAQAIFEGLGGKTATQKKNGYFENGTDIVTWCFGHMLELFDPEDYDPSFKTWRLDDLPLKAVYPPKLKPILKSVAQLNIITGLIKKADSIVNAGDPDEEGNLLIDEILTHVNNQKPVKRLLVADLNVKAVKKSLASMRPNSEFASMTQSALARSIGDQLFGYNLTRAFTLKAKEKGYGNVLNVGRVQTAVLGLINTRTLANLNHSESFYYVLSGAFSFSKGSINAKHVPFDDDNTDEKNRLTSELDAVMIQEHCLNQAASITDINTKAENKAAPLPFNLSTLQQTCAKQHGYSADDTLKLVQSLYETHKLLTYPRSDCRYLSDEHYAGASEVLTAIAGTAPGLNAAIEGGNPQLKHKAFNGSKITAHHAIIPTEKSGASITLSPKESTVYELVAKSFVALFYPASVRDKTRLEIDCQGRVFIATQSNMTAQGWEVLYRGEIEEERESKQELDLREVSKDTGTNQSLDIDKKKTTPPKYFVESSLLAAMTRAAKFIEDPTLRAALEAKDKDNASESGSIGTEATRAAILKKLANNPLITISTEKGYKEKVWKTTEQGREFCALLPKEIVAPDTSALWAQKQQAIRAGESTVKAFVSDLDDYLAQRIADVKTNGVPITIKNKISCPKCQVGALVKRKGKYGFFWACNRYPECKSHYPDDNGKPNFEDKKKSTLAVSESEFCKQCGSALIRRPAKKEGVFWWGCSGYPKCTIRFFDLNGKPDRDKGEMR